MDNFLQDLRVALRALIKNPGFNIIAITALALGTGANSAIFSVINAVLLRPLPFDNPDRLVLVWERNPTTPRYPISFPDFFDFRDQNQSFDQMAAFSYADFNLTMGDEPEHLQGSMVTANYFSVLSVSFKHGRAFQPDEDQPGAPRVVILSDALWKRRFGSDANLIGQTITLNDAGFTVIGIAPDNFQSPAREDKPQVWVTLSTDGSDRLRVPPGATPESLRVRRARFLNSAARLKPGVTAAQAQADLATIASRLEEQYKDTNAGIGVTVLSLNKHIIGNIGTALWTLFASVICVLLIACANVANLLLARAAARQKEIAIRSALGATRSRLIRQLLTESVVLSLVGGVLGVVIAYGGVRLLISLNPPNLPRLSEINLDSRVLGFTFIVAIVTGLLFGLAPALQASKPNLNETLKEGSRGSTGGLGRQRIRSALVVAEVALTVLLLIAAGLMLKSFYSLQNVKPGFDPANTLTMTLNLPSSKYTDDQQIKAFYEQVLNGVSALPGVQSAAAVSSLPLTTNVVERLRFTVEGHPPANPADVPRANIRRITSGYFSTMRIPLIEGRFFNERDRDDSPPVAIVNQTMASAYWPGEDPVGRRLTVPSLGSNPREVVGVVADVKHSSLDSESGAEIYVPSLQKPFSLMTLVVHTSGEPLSMSGAVRGAILSVDRGQPAYDIKTMQDVVSDSLSQPRLYTVLLGVFGALAMILAAVGIYGVMAYSVTQRTHEIGIRMALGAQQGDILKMVVGQGMVLTVIGTVIGLTVIGAVIGLLAVFGLTGAMEALPFSVGSRDLATFIGIPLVLALIAFLSSYIPARRATKIDPMIALRVE